MQLLLLHPEVAFISCEHCQKYVYDITTGRAEEWPPGSGMRQERPKGTTSPCVGNPKACPKVSPDSGYELSDRNIQCFTHYRECRAIGEFPDDPLVRFHAGIIRSVEDDAERMERREFQVLLQSLILRAAVNG